MRGRCNDGSRDPRQARQRAQDPFASRLPPPDAAAPRSRFAHQRLCRPVPAIRAWAFFCSFRLLLLPSRKRFGQALAQPCAFGGLYAFQKRNVSSEHRDAQYAAVELGRPFSLTTRPVQHCLRPFRKMFVFLGSSSRPMRCRTPVAMPRRPTTPSPPLNVRSSA